MKNVTHLTKTLLNGLIDYAGLFPPAAETMRDAVGKYAAYLVGEYSFALARFVVPVSRLGELVEAAEGIAIEKEWRLSALAGTDLRKDVDSIERFNDCYAGQFVIDTMEIKAAEVSTIERGTEVIPQEITAYYEIPLTAAATPLVAALRGSPGRAKIRTGSVDESAIPNSAALAAFLKLAAASSMPFKATAGLHHPLCKRNPQTSILTHGFLNLILTAAFVREGMEEEEARECLEDVSPAAFRFEPESASWRDWKLGAAELAVTRSSFLISFGSCSFTEPIDDLKGLGLL